MPSQASPENPEQKVERCFREGRRAEFGNIPVEQESEKTIRASFLRELIMKRIVDASVAPIGFAITGAIIDGDLVCRGFGSAAAPLPALDLSKCEIKGAVDLTESCWVSIALDGCSLRGLRAPHLRAEKRFSGSDIALDAQGSATIDLEGLVTGADLDLWRLGRAVSAGTKPPAACSLNLRQSRLGGGVYLAGSRLANANGNALTMDNAKVTGSLFLGSLNNHRFEAEGEVRLAGTKIGGQLNCIGGSFNNANGDALSMDNAEVTGAVFLRSSDKHRFEAKGKVRLLGAKINGQVSCIGGSFNNANGDALSMDNAEVTGALLLQSSDKHRFEAIGEVRLLGARINGQVSCIGGSFENANGDALSMDSAEVTGPLFLQSSEKHRFEAKGEVRLLGARINGQVSCIGGSFENANGDALSMDNAEVTGAVLLRSSDKHRFEANGKVRLTGAKIGGQLNCIGGSFENANGDALSMDNAEVTGSLFLQSSDKHRFEAKGRVRLLGAKINGQVSCVGSSFDNTNGDALSMENAEVTGPVFLRSSNEHRFEAKGAVRLLGAKIGGQLDLAGANLANPAGTALSLEHATIRESVFMRAWGEHQFQALGQVVMTSTSVDGSLHCRGRFEASEELLNLESAEVRRAFRISLAQESSGTVSLRGAHVEELDDDGGYGWGQNASVAGNGGATKGVLLRLDGFTYERLGIWKPPNARGWQKLLWPLKRTIGLGVAGDRWWHRAKWLERQHIGEVPKADDFFPQPHEQLSKVLRLMGHDYDARRITTHKFAHEDRCGANEFVARFFMRLYRWGFGCGYLPIRALVTVLAWFAAGWLAISCALHENENGNVVLVRATTGVDIVRVLSRPDEPPLSSSKSGPYAKFETRDIACDEISPALYVLDTMLPVFQLHMEGKCEFTDNSRQGRQWRLGKAVYALFGWIIVTLAALTWTGVLRREPS